MQIKVIEVMTDLKNIDIEDKGHLRTYLHNTKRIKDDEDPEFKILDGGVSNRTVWVQRKDETDWILKQALEKLRVQTDWFSAPERIHREAAGLRWLSDLIPDNVPSFIFEDMEWHILAMSAIAQPHENWKSVLLQGEPLISHAVQFGDLLAHIHNAIEDYPAIAQDFADAKFFEELRLDPYYAYTASQVVPAEDFLNTLIHDTRQRRQALVHGDYSPKNVLIYDNRLYILDYEVIHFGDPAFDIGFSMTHFLSKAHYRKAHRQTFIAMASAYWETYSNNISQHFISQSIEPYAVKHTLACLLARVAGRSPLEYLDATHRERQKEIVLQLIDEHIETIPDLITRFEERLDATYDDN